MKIVETDNFDRDYPDEKFHFWPMELEHAKSIADALNTSAGPNSDRFWKVTENDYKLEPGFEP